ncbi:hypothetical protein CRG98_048316, partial [Punica granatum]
LNLNLEREEADDEVGDDAIAGKLSRFLRADDRRCHFRPPPGALRGPEGSRSDPTPGLDTWRVLVGARPRGMVARQEIEDPSPPPLPSSGSSRGEGGSHMVPLYFCRQSGTEGVD